MDKKTKTEIWEAFKDKFIEEGINSPEEMNFQYKIPSEAELVKNRGILKKMGQVGKLVIWIVKGAIWVGTVIVLYADMPDALEQIKTRHPQAFRGVNTIGKAIDFYHKNSLVSKVSEVEGENKYPGQYVVFNRNWVNDKIKFAGDVKALDNSGKISDGSVLAPATGLNDDIIVLSDISVSPSDFT